MDEQTIKLIDKIAEEHSHKVFGYLDRSDLKNEIWVICLEQMKYFNGDRGHLEHFLRKSVKNRLINKFKDITKTVKSPCLRCPLYRANSEVDCSKFKQNKERCDKWHNYQLSVESRNSLLNASEYKTDRGGSDNTSDILAGKEICQIIINHIDTKFLHDFEQFLARGKLSKRRSGRLRKEIARILDKIEADKLEALNNDGTQS